MITKVSQKIENSLSAKQGAINKNSIVKNSNRFYHTNQENYNEVKKYILENEYKFIADLLKDGSDTGLVYVPYLHKNNKSDFLLLQRKFLYPVNKKNNTGKRAKIHDFSNKSRMRLKRKLGFLPPDLKINMITLTYPLDNFPDEKKSKEQLRKFIRSLNYRYEKKFFIIWKREFQKNGVPHYHCLINRDVPKNVIKHLWTQSINDYRKKVFNASTRIERIRKTTHYIAKYLSKDLNNNINGRTWGIYNRKEFKRVCNVKTYEISDKKYKRIKRECVKYLRKQGIRARSSWSAFFVPQKAFDRYISYLDQEINNNLHIDILKAKKALIDKGIERKEVYKFLRYWWKKSEGKSLNCCSHAPRSGKDKSEVIFKNKDSSFLNNYERVFS